MARLALHDILCRVLKGSFSGEDTSKHCYFSPPNGMQLKYPCIVYKHTNDLDEFADNIPYKSSKRYTVTIIDEDPDSKIPSKLKKTLPYCMSDRNFETEGLSHFVYTLFYDGPRIKEEKDNG